MDSSFRSWKTHNNYKVVRVLSGRSNAYLILKDSSIILVDTGKEASYKTLLKNLAMLNIAVEDLSVLILTHVHFDHCQSARKIKEKSNCKVVVSELAAESIRNGYGVLPKGTFLITKLISRVGRFIGKGKFGFEPFHPDLLVNVEYDLQKSECKIKIIESPGHSSDSISVIVDNEIAICGDAMFGVLKNSIFPPFSDNCAKMVESWGKLLNSGCNIFLPGHGNEIKRSLLQKEYDKYSRRF